MVRKTLSLILKEEFKSSQPSTEPGEIFLQLRFGTSSSYTSKVLFFLVKEGFANFFNRFSANEDRIVSFLHGKNDNSGILKISDRSDPPDTPVLNHSVYTRV